MDIVVRQRASLVALLLPVIIIFAFGLRLHNLDGFSFWTDEGLTPLRASYSIVEILSNEIIIQEGIGKDTHPPLFYLVLHFSRQLFGETDFAYRYPALLAGVLLVPLLFQFGRRLRGSDLGFMAAMLGAELETKTAVPDDDYTTLIHLAQPGQPPLATGDHPPLNGQYPAGLWAVGELFDDKYTLIVPEDAANGRYPIWIGMYEPKTQTRLPLHINGQRQPNDVYRVGWLEIVP